MIKKRLVWQGVPRLAIMLFRNTHVPPEAFHKGRVSLVEMLRDKDRRILADGRRKGEAVQRCNAQVCGKLRMPFNALRATKSLARMVSAPNLSWWAWIYWPASAYGKNLLDGTSIGRMEAWTSPIYKRQQTGVWKSSCNVYPKRHLQSVMPDYHPSDVTYSRRVLAANPPKMPKKRTRSLRNTYLSVSWRHILVLTTKINFTCCSLVATLDGVHNFLKISSKHSSSFESPGRGCVLGTQA